MASRTSQRLIQSKERRLKAFAMRKRGYTFEQIGDALNISRQAAHKLVDNYITEMEALTDEEAKKLIKIELSRLDDLMTVAYNSAMNDKETPGNRLKAIDRVLKVMERRSNMLGLDAPKKIAPTDPQGNELKGAGAGLASLLAAAEHLTNNPE